MRFRAYWLAFLSLLIAFGCQPEPQHVTQPKREKEYKKLVSLSPSATEIVARYGPMERLVGRTSACDWPTHLKDNKSIQVVGDHKPNYEKIAEIKPDLILFDDSAYNEADMEKLKQLGVDIFELKADTLDQFMDEMYRAGLILGNELSFSEYVDKIVRARSSASAVAAEKRLKVALLLPGGADYMIAGTKSFQADLIRASGGEPVGPPESRFVPANLEALIEMNPDVLVLADQHAFDSYVKLSAGATEEQDRRNRGIGPVAPAQVLNDARLRSIEAIKLRQIATLDPDIALRKGSRVDVFIEGLSGYLDAVGN